MGNKSRKNEILHLTTRCHSSYNCCQLGKKAQRTRKQEISPATCCINFNFSYSSYIKEILKTSKENKRLVKDQSPELKVSKVQRIIIQGGGKKDMQ